MKTMTDDEKYAAIVNKDIAANGTFIVGVLTTGVFCLPSCSARTPKRENVRFFDGAEGALEAGLRPCMKCRPTAENRAHPQSGLMRKLCRHIRENPDQNHTLEGLGELAGLSPTYLQKVFTESIGVSPKTFAEACRLQMLRGLLRKGSSAGSAVENAGFGSQSRLYEKLDSRLGMTPRDYKRNGAGLTISYVSVISKLGHLMIAATDRGICFVQFGDYPATCLNELTREFSAAELSPMEPGMNPDLEAWVASLERHLQGDLQTFQHLPIDIAGTAFQAKVWKFLQTIPSGDTRSYSQVAQAIGQPKAVRAVASACAANRIAVMIPCHRVLRGTGEISGYRWGIERKQALLRLETA